MTAITRSRSSPSSATQKTPFRAPETSEGETSVFSPSSTVEEAKSRFAMAVSSGVDAVMRFGHGIDRASVEILNEIADGCPPDEEEIFKTMASFGVSLDDATKASTVSAAFRRAIASKGSPIKAIDELTSRLHLANLTHRSEALRPHFTTASSHNNVVADPEQNNPSTDTLATPPPNQFLTAEGRKVPLRSKVGDKQTPHKGKKRALSDKGNEKLSTSNTTLEAKAADVEVKAKISKEDEKKAKDLSGRSKSAAPAGGRGKRPSLRSDEGQPVKRVRSTSTI